MGFGSVHHDVAVGVVRSSLLEPNPLVPAVHAADRIRLNWKRQILVNTDLSPPDACAIRIVAAKRPGPVHLAHLILAVRTASDLHERRGIARAALVLVEPPSAEMVRHRHDAGPDPLGDPRACDEETDARMDLDEISGRDA